MREDKWKDTIAMVKDKFTVLNSGKEELEDIPNGTREFIEFESPQGKIRLDFIVRPAVLDKKTTYSKLGGSAANIEYIYSKDEMVRRMEAFRWSEATAGWEEIKTPF